MPKNVARPSLAFMRKRRLVVSGEGEVPDSQPGPALSDVPVVEEPVVEEAPKSAAMDKIGEWLKGDKKTKKASKKVASKK